MKSVINYGSFVLMHTDTSIFVCCQLRFIFPSETAPDDFLPLENFPVVFTAGSAAGTRQNFQVVIVNDNVFEANETFLLRSTDNNQCSDPAQNSAVVTIKDDDAREYTKNLNNNY